MSVDHANVQQRAGADIVGRLANATLSVGAVEIDGYLAQVDAQPSLGGFAVQSQRTQFTFETELLEGQALAEEDAVSVAYLGDTLSFKVALRTDKEQQAQTVLDLKLA